MRAGRVGRGPRTKTEGGVDRARKTRRSCPGTAGRMFTPTSRHQRNRFLLIWRQTPSVFPSGSSYVSIAQFLFPKSCSCSLFFFFLWLSYSQNHQLFSTPFSIMPNPTGIEDFCNPAATNFKLSSPTVGQPYNVWEQGLWRHISSANLVSSTFYLFDPGQIT